jgi:hypothetical protein
MPFIKADLKETTENPGQASETPEAQEVAILVTFACFDRAVRS